MAVTPLNLAITDITATSVQLNWVRWTPLQIFLAGEKGAWYDPSDLYTLFQDAAGTVPVTADGDPVGLMLDKSGNGYHASQSVSVSRPLYRTDGTLHWLEFDGVDDFLVSTDIDFTATDKMTQVVGVQSDDSQRIIMEFGFDNLYIFSAASFQVEAESRSSYQTSPWTRTNKNIVSVIASVSENVLSVRVNQGAFSTSNSVQDSGNYKQHALTIGRRGNGDLPFGGKVYGLVIRGAETTLPDLAKLEQYSASLTGVAL